MSVLVSKKVRCAPYPAVRSPDETSSWFCSNTRAAVHLESGTITRIVLDVEAVVPGIDEAKFQEYAAEAKAKCPVSKALAAVEERKPVTAISPITGGQTVKGPAAKMYSELGIELSAFAVANHYRGLATGFVLDEVDSQLDESVRGLNMRTLVTNTLMKSHDDRKRLANDVLHFIGVNV